jgi:hypothetical protein
LILAVVGWLPFLSVVVYMAYNIGDGAYPRKFNYALDAIRQIEKNGRKP